ncbi:MAG: nuclear transport factor 2 family protein, partial [Chloroflexota bacterium]
ALATYRYPKAHPQLPYVEFLEYCDLNMPQVYWMGSSNPDVQLIRSIHEYESLPVVRPMVPIGFAFKEHGYAPELGENSLFMRTAQEQRLTAANFWSWDSSRRYLPHIWNEIRDYSWPSKPQPKDITQQYIDALNTHDPAQIAKLYTSDGVHVNASRTVQGVDALQNWYSALLNQILPDGHFSLTGLGGKDNRRYMTWSATSSLGEVLDGSDTLGILDGKIAYHYTYYTIA